MTYSWTFGDGTTASGSLNPAHTYANPGSDTATVTVTDANGVSSSSSVAVTVNDVAPTVSVTVPSGGEAGVAANFSASATDISPAVQAAGFTYSWNFGDGGTTTGASSSHTFAAAGTYTVTVTAKDEYGTTGTATGSVIVVGPPTVNAGSAFSVNAGASTTFSQATESGGTAPFTYSWTYGDGNTATGSLNPSHTYANPGSDTATVTVTDANNLSSSSSVAVTVNDVAAHGQPDRSVRGSGWSCGQLLSQRDGHQPGRSSRGIHLCWNFGDGGTGTGANPSHTFATAGTYTVTATATDEYGKSGTASGTVVIVGAAPPSVKAGSAFSVNAGTLTTFSQATESGGTAPFTYSWTFGDGTTATGSLNPSHTYANPGTDTATVTVTDANKLSSSSSVVVTVNDVAPKVTVTVPPAGEVGVAATFSASATDISPAVQAAGFTYSWNFGDGGTTTGASPSHTFAAAGTYTVTVTATDEYGKTGTASGTVVIVGPPTVKAGSAFSVNAGASTTFSQATESGGTAPFTYSWTFGDGTTASGSLNPSHTYANPGTFTATVTVTDADKLSSSSSVAVTVNDVAPTVSWSELAGTAGSPASFTATATDISPAVQAAGFTYSWNFGDGGTGTGASTTHTFAAAGTYTVTATATDEYGKSGTSTGTVVIGNPSGVPTQFLSSGTATSPVDPGFTKMDGEIDYTAALGYGWIPGVFIQERDRGTGSDMDRAFDFTTTAPRPSRSISPMVPTISP